MDESAPVAESSLPGGGAGGVDDRNDDDHPKDVEAALALAIAVAEPSLVAEPLPVGMVAVDVDANASSVKRVTPVGCQGGGPLAQPDSLGQQWEQPALKGLIAAPGERATVPP